MEPDVLVDLPPAIDVQLRAIGRDLSRVSHLVVTHAHADHLYLPHLRRRAGLPAGAAEAQVAEDDELARRRVAAPRVGPLPVLTVVASPPVLGRIRQALGPDAENTMAVRLQPILPGESVAAGAMRFTAVRAHHEVEGDTPYNYVIEGPAEHRPGERACLFYGCDTGPLRHDAWEVLQRFRFDAVILDATGGDAEPEAFPYHLTLYGAMDVVAAMREQGLLNQGARIILAHLNAHHWPLHEEAQALVAPLGWEVAFDGMELVL